jgi:GxxExxY protein
VAEDKDSMEDQRLTQITEIIIGCAFNVSNSLGIGFLEKVYHNSLLIELMKTELKIESQKPISVYYENQIVGEFFADIMVEDQVIVELKAARSIEPLHEAQMINYLRACNRRYGLILNFGTSKLGIKRMLYGY